MQLTRSLLHFVFFAALSHFAPFKRLEVQSQFSPGQFSLEFFRSSSFKDLLPSPLKRPLFTYEELVFFRRSSGVSLGFTWPPSQLSLCAQMRQNCCHERDFTFGKSTASSLSCCDTHFSLFNISSLFLSGFPPTPLCAKLKLLCLLLGPFKGLRPCAL